MHARLRPYVVESNYSAVYIYDDFMEEKALFRILCCRESDFDSIFFVLLFSMIVARVENVLK